MKNSFAKNSLFILFINLVAIIAAYYVAILLHEWGHGTAAWLLGQKSSPFNVNYDSWSLLKADENVNYDGLISSHHGAWAAIIGISGLGVTIVLVILSFILLNRPSMQRHPMLFTFFYWFLIINMVAIFQYIPLTTFSSEGDVGRFIHGLTISPWWVFILGTILVVIALWRIFKIEIPRAYAVIPIKSIGGQRLFLLTTLCILFLLIYTHGYNPFADKGSEPFNKVLAAFSILLIPILFFVCNPSRPWVRKIYHRLNSVIW